MNSGACREDMDMTRTDQTSIYPELRDDADRWRATEQRDARYDGEFVYAVRSTGIYCRPSCPSRRPRRDQVRFFDDCARAEAAGFRPCRRCRPTEMPREKNLIQRIDDYVREHLDEPITLAMLGEACGLSPYHVQRTFKRLTGLTPRQYIQERRLEQLKAHLRDGSDVTTAMYDAGFGSSSRLYEGASSRLGMTPGVYGRRGADLEITYTIVDCALGRLLVGATSRGICAVCVGDTDDELEAALRDEYPAASLKPGTFADSSWADSVVAVANGQPLQPDLPLDVRATVFERRVWSFLRTIPLGETRSYADVACSLDQPGAARAVARACAANPVALIVPCHRVVRANGEPGGYRWGEQRKRTLLAVERERSVAGASAGG